MIKPPLIPPQGEKPPLTPPKEGNNSPLSGELEGAILLERAGGEAKKIIVQTKSKKKNYIIPRSF